MPEPLTALLLTAASIGVVHTLIGPDHYVPFLALARARDWSLGRTVGITLACGLGHVAASVALGGMGILLGWALGGLESFEALRGEVAAWLLLAFGLAYAVWGIRRGLTARRHSHRHAHVDGEVHEHLHRHRKGHVHVHGEEADRGGTALRRMTPWALFLIFVFGPCEALIPLLMYPASQGAWWQVALVVTVFAVGTLGTMAAAVAAGHLGLSRLSFGALEPYSHALAGLALAACGLAIRLGL